MKTQADFEAKLNSLCKSSAPILHALLNASFMSLLAMEGAVDETHSGFKLFERGRVLPLSVLLLLDRQELLTDTRIMLPFWYTIPVISAIIAFFNRPRTPKAKTSRKTEERRDERKESDDGRADRDRKKAELKAAAEAVQRRLIPEGSTLEAEMAAQLELWNRTLDPQIKTNLTEDVNSLVRDYMRRIIRSIKASSFNRARVENLATTLVDTPGLMKIKNRDALLAYVQLYIVELVRALN